jgi:hypothetical protein
MTGITVKDLMAEQEKRLRVKREKEQENRDRHGRYHDEYIYEIVNDRYECGETND